MTRKGAAWLTDRRGALLLMAFLGLNLLVAGALTMPPPRPYADHGIELSAQSVLLWVSLGIFNLALAGLILSVRPRRFAHWLVAAWFIANGVGVPARYILEPLRDAQGWFEPLAYWPSFIEAVTFIPLVLIPFVFPRRLLRPGTERALLLALCGLLVVWWWTLPFMDSSGDLAAHHVVGALASLAGYLGLLAGCAVFAHGYLKGPTQVHREQSRYMLGAYLVTAAAFAVLGNPLFMAAPDLAGANAAAAVVFLFAAQNTARILLATAAVALVFATMAANRIARAARREPAPMGGDVLLVALAAGGILHPFLGLQSDIVWMVLRPLLFTYAILRFRLLDVELPQRSTTIATALVAGLLVLHITTHDALTGAGADPAVTASVATVATIAFGAIMAWPVLSHLVATWTGRAPSRGREAYRAALEQHVLMDREDAGGEILHALRGHLGISEREHAVMELGVRAAHTAPGDPVRPADRFLGRYRVERLLGEGGHSRTFLAVDEQLDRTVVLKVTRWDTQADTRRALGEGRILARMGHPHIVSIHDMEQIGDELILVLEHVPGGSLADALADGPLPRERVRAVMDGVFSGLEAAHREGIVHRDLKPGNILLAADGAAKLADFGIASDEQTMGTATGPFSTRAPAGTLRYMSPEQARGLGASPQSDIYSAGVVLYEALTGRPYLELDGRPDFEVRLAIIEETPRLDGNGIHPAEAAFLARLLDKDPLERPPDAAAARQELRRAVGTTATPEGRLPIRK